MLYISTRNSTDCYTAYRALNEAQTPDGGIFIPFRLTAFTKDELQQIHNSSCCEAIAKVLNQFFGLSLSGWDVECVIGRNPLKPVTMNQKVLFAEGWRNPESSFQYLLNALYRRMTGRYDPSGWACIAIEIALLFGLFAAIGDAVEQGLDIALNAGDFADLTAVSFAKKMGLPVNMIICTCKENSAAWNLFTKGEFNINSPSIATSLTKLDIAQPAYLESYIFAKLGMDEVKQYLDACANKQVYRVDEKKIQLFNENIYSAVVSANRVEAIVTGMYRTNGYVIDPYTAFAYGGLQDFRAKSGANRETLILAKYRPATEKE